MADEKSLAKPADQTNNELALSAQSGLKADEPINLTHLTMNQLNFIGAAMTASGAFKDVKRQSQALVRILAGQEMGLGPFAAMSNISIIEGNASVGGHIMAARVKASPKYDYKVVKWDRQSCVIDFYELDPDTKELLKIGTSDFTMQDAQAANLTGKFNWKAYPRNMLFNRAISNGVRTYCPDVLGNAPVYDPDELGAKLNEQGNIVELPKNSVPQTKPAPAYDEEVPVEEDQADDEVEVSDSDLSDAMDETLAENKPVKPNYGPKPSSGLARPEQRTYYKKLLEANNIQAPEAKQVAQTVLKKNVPTTYDDFEAVINFVTTGELPGQASLIEDEK